MGRLLELIWFQAYKDLRAEATRGYLGFLWWIIEPLLYMFIFYLVFQLGFRGGGRMDFLPFLLCGLIVWKWFHSTIVRGCNLLNANKSIILQVYLPKYIFPVVLVLSNTIRFIVLLFVFIIFLLIFNYPITIAWLSLPVVIVAQMLLITACVGLVTAVVPFIPDLRLVVVNGVFMLLFMSGIFYDIGSFPESIRFYFRLNPMATIIEAYRMILLDGYWPDWISLLVVVLSAIVVGIIAVRLLVRFDRIYPKVLV